MDWERGINPHHSIHSYPGASAGGGGGGPPPLRDRIDGSGWVHHDGRGDGGDYYEGMNQYYSDRLHGGGHLHATPWRTHGVWHSQRLSETYTDIGDTDHDHPHLRTPGYYFNPRWPHSLSNIAAPFNHAHSPPNAFEAPLHGNNNYPNAGHWDFNDPEYVFS